ncbi:MAG: hypothetical protein NTX03_13600 [Bacteroidetes bacterium]|nr:hypothetical protein [Bacteroidota bacterium]
MTPAPIQYVNENLTAGNWGYFFVVLSFGAAFFAMLAYIMFMRTRESGWKLMARTGFALHGIGVIGIGVMLFFLIFNHRFEYYYVWNHSSRDLPTHYILACFWAGQEGSFLLWTFWHVILGGILIWRAKTFETPVMIVICAVQLMLASMLLGLDKLDIFGSIVNLPIKLGSNPFILLRKAMPNIPFFTDPNLWRGCGNADTQNG